MVKRFEGYPRAMKQYECLYCRHKIVVGEVYYRKSYFDTDERKWIRYRLHKECKVAFFHALAEVYSIEQHWEDWYDQMFWRSQVLI